jgi:antitoxin VapB
MPLYIRNKKAELLAREAAQRYGVSVTDAVITALEQQLERPQFSSDHGRSAVARQANKLMETGQRCAALPDRDSRSADEILGYGQDGVPI